MNMKFIRRVLLASVGLCDATMIPIQTFVDSSGHREIRLNVSITGTSNIATVSLVTQSDGVGITNSSPMLTLWGGGFRPRFYPLISMERGSFGTLGRFVTEPVDLDQINSIPPYSGQIVIAPGTPFVRFFNSVDYVWNTVNYENKLILSSSFEWFNSTACYPDSVMSVGVGSSGDFEVETYVNYDGRNITEISNYILSSNVKLTEVPPRVYLMTAANLLRAGVPVEMYRSRIPESFENCTAVRQMLHPISFGFPTGKITLYPDDYTENIVGDRCRLLISTPTSAWSSGPLLMNPLAFKGLNVRFTRNEMVFCESTIDYDLTSIH